jgi:hypothetical protein
MPNKIHHHCSTAARWDAGESPRRRRIFRAILCLQWSEAGLHPCSDALQLDVSAMLTDAFDGTNTRIGIKWRFKGSVFNLRWLQAKTKVQSDTINLLLADDSSLNATSKANMQHSVDKFFDACDNFDLTISTKKTEVMHQPNRMLTLKSPSTTNG